MKILLGGIPLGCDNIGDEAIIAGVVKMLKESLPGVELTVATDDPATAALLGVNVVPVFGFRDVGFLGFAEEVRRHDAYIWCGATGLSDYPHVALELLEIAQGEGVPTFVWGVGMDDELNPVFFKVAGKRRLLLSLFGLVGWYERRLRARLKRRIARVLPRCKGVWLRDPQSAAMLAQMGFPNASIAADTAILFSCEFGGDARPRSRGTRDPTILQSYQAPSTKHQAPSTKHQAPSTKHQAPTLGLCISTQRQVADLDGVRRMIAAVRDSGARVLGIPMNIKTDRTLLESLGVECIPGTTPEAVMAAAATCDVVLSSRLHLLILAANAGTPGLGIARGSKLANWLSNFGQSVVGSVYDCDWDKVTEQVLAALKDRGDWDSIRAAAYERLMSRLEKARAELIAKLAPREGTACP